MDTFFDPSPFTNGNFDRKQRVMRPFIDMLAILDVTGKNRNSGTITITIPSSRVLSLSVSAVLGMVPSGHVIPIN